MKMNSIVVLIIALYSNVLLANENVREFVPGDSCKYFDSENNRDIYIRKGNYVTYRGSFYGYNSLLSYECNENNNIKNISVSIESGSAHSVLSIYDEFKVLFLSKYGEESMAEFFYDENGPYDRQLLIGGSETASWNSNGYSVFLMASRIKGEKESAYYVGIQYKTKEKA